MTQTDDQNTNSQAQGPFADLAFHTIGWKAFQNMCAQICQEELDCPVSIYREAQDGGQDAVFLINSAEDGAKSTGTIQVKHTADPKKN